MCFMSKHTLHHTKETLIQLLSYSDNFIWVVYGWFASKNGLSQRHVIQRDWTACLQCDSHSRLSNQYNWDGLYDHLISTRIFTLTMNKICVWAPRIMREVASSLIRFANHLVLLVSSYFKRSRPVRKSNHLRHLPYGRVPGAEFS